MPSISPTLPQVDSMLQQLTVVNESINVKLKSKLLSIFENFILILRSYKHQIGLHLKTSDVTDKSELHYFMLDAILKKCSLHTNL